MREQELQPRAEPALPESAGECSEAMLRILRQRSYAFLMLGRRLSGAATVRHAAEILVGVADELLGWDSCGMYLYSPELDLVNCPLSMDVVNGHRVELSQGRGDAPPTPRLRQVMTKGAQLILREKKPRPETEATFIGDTGRPSASLMFVPMRYRDRVMGVFTIQSYAFQAYTKTDLETLQALADLGAGVIQRLQAETQYRSLFEEAIEGIWRVTPAGRFLSANPALACMLGYASVEALTAAVTDLGAQLCVDPERWRQFRQEVESRERLQGFPLELHHRDGGRIWVSLNARVNRDDQGRASYYEGTAQDITDRKRADEQLRRTEDLYRRAIAGAGTVPYAYDFQTRSYLFIGEGIEKLIGYRPEEVSRELWLRIVQENIMVGEAAGLDKFEAARRVRTGELRHWRCDMRVLTKDGRSRWIADVSVQNQDDSGRAISSMGILEDVTERKESEAKLEQLHRQLVEVSRQAGMAEVATSVLHNVGNVLNSVNISRAMIAEKIRDSKAGNLSKAVALLETHAQDLAHFLIQDPKGRQLPAYLGTLAAHLAEERKQLLAELDELGKNIEHINEIVAMQQSYAKICGVLDVLPLANLIEDALRLNAGALQRHGVRIVREFAPMAPMLLDKHKVLQILVNLIRNAKYALDEGSHADKCLTLRVAPTEHNTVRVSVIDNGVGIAPSNLTRIFEHGFTTRKTGHGFGLHNGALAAREMGGSLTVRSEGPGRGAEFVLELPIREN